MLLGAISLIIFVAEGGNAIPPWRHLLTLSTTRIWPNGIIPYRLVSYDDTDKNAVDNIRDAMDSWQNKTCIRFVPEAEYQGSSGVLSIFNADSPCRALVGYYGVGGSEVFLGAERCGTSMQTIIHEFGHVIGLKHEDTRSDRDEYLTLADAFHWEKDNEPGLELLTPYDYLSVMQTSSLGVANNAIWGRYKKTMNSYNTKDPCYQQFVGRTIYPSFYDTKGINLAYSCASSCTEEVRELCELEGDDCFVGGTDCSCICPGMWTDPCNSGGAMARTLVPCGSGMWTCHDGRCIDERWVCDKYPDCDDGEDEICAGFHLCPLDAAPNPEVTISGEAMSCADAVARWPRLVCLETSPFVDKCCRECHSANVTTAICHDLNECQAKNWNHCNDPEVRNACPFLCSDCYRPKCDDFAPCANGGSFDLFCACHCLPGFAGDKCEKTVCLSDACSTVCLNGGTPLTENGVTTCSCPSKYKGDKCQCQSIEGIAISLKIGAERWKLMTCGDAFAIYPKTTCLSHSTECCEFCDSEELRCHDEPSFCAVIQAGECHTAHEKEKCPAKCGICAEDQCPGVECLNGGTLIAGCECRCPATHRGDSCEVENKICEGDDNLDSSLCRLFTESDLALSFCKSENRIHCCASCRDFYGTQTSCHDDETLCGEGKTYWDAFYCHRSDTEEQARKHCPKMCGNC